MKKKLLLVVLGALGALVIVVTAIVAPNYSSTAGGPCGSGWNVNSLLHPYHYAPGAVYNCPAMPLNQGHISLSTILYLLLAWVLVMLLIGFIINRRAK